MSTEKTADGRVGEIIASNISNQMDAKGISPSELAKLYGCSRQNIHVFTSNGTTNLLTLMKLAKCLKCSFRTFLKDIKI